MKANKIDNSVSRFATKKDFQVILKKLRQAGYEVKKTSLAGYEVLIEGNLVLKAMNGSQGYLIRHNRSLFENDPINA